MVSPPPGAAEEPGDGRWRSGAGLLTDFRGPLPPGPGTTGVWLSKFIPGKTKLLSHEGGRKEYQGSPEGCGTFLLFLTFSPSLRSPDLSPVFLLEVTPGP